MKFVVTDLDGTLLFSRNVISEKNKCAIKKLIEKGIKFAIASGRGKEGIEFLINELGVRPYIVGNNGATIYDDNGNCIFHKTIKREVVVEILKIIKENGAFYSCFIDNYFYHDKDDNNEFSGRELFEKRILERPEDCPELNKIIVSNNANLVAKLAKILKDNFSDFVEITISEPECLDIVPKNCSKGTGVKTLSEIFKIDLSEFMAFGDGENDIEMLRVVGHPVIMENAQELLHKEFKNIAPKNTEDGVAKYLNKYFNLEELV